MDLRERRRDERYIAWLPAVLVAEGHGAQQATIVDLSVGGALVEVATELERGCAVDLLMQSDDSAVSIKGVILGGMEGPGWLLNIQFDDTQTAAASVAIERAVRQLAA